MWTAWSGPPGLLRSRSRPRWTPRAYWRRETRRGRAPAASTQWRTRSRQRTYRGSGPHLGRISCKGRNSFLKIKWQFTPAIVLIRSTQNCIYRQIYFWCCRESWGQGGRWALAACWRRSFAISALSGKYNIKNLHCRSPLLVLSWYSWDCICILDCASHLFWFVVF